MNIQNYSALDIKFMERALRLAAKAKGMTSPNPMVGAVIVKNGKIISEGFHEKPGSPHAEAVAIAQAGKKARNASLYVTLEPCCHFDKRTPPCTKMIINYGIKKVFIAMRDPNPKVSGKGVEELLRYGIKVNEGILEDKAKSLNEAYIKYITTGKPFVILKVAMTLDGKIANHTGDSKWITNEKSRTLVHKIRNGVDAVMTAVGTVIADNPQFTVRLYKKNPIKNPLRVVIDPTLEIPIDFNVFDCPPETILVTKKMGSQKFPQTILKKTKKLTEKGVKLLEYEGDRVDLGWLMTRLGENGITSLMIEAGSSFSANCLNQGIVDKVIFFISPKILGGKSSITAVGGDNLRDIKNALKIDPLKINKVGDDIMIEGYLKKDEGGSVENH